MENLIYVFAGFIGVMLVMGLIDVILAVDLDWQDFPTKKKDSD